MRPWVLLMLALGQASLLRAQVAPAFEVRSAHEQELQSAYVQELKGIASDVKAHAFPYPFDLSRAVDAASNTTAGGGAIRFGVYQNQSVLEITGNYNAAYAAQLVDASARTRTTFLDVMVPVLNAADARLSDARGFQSYLLEVSYHIRRKVLGVDSEGVETFAVLLPREVTTRLLRAKSADEKQDALLNGTAFLNGEPFLLWVNDDGLNDADRKRILERSLARQSGSPPPNTDSDDHPLVAADLVKMPEWLRKPEESLPVADLATKYQTELDRLTHELDGQAHFVGYAPPAFIDFHGGRYLQLTTYTPLEGATSDSRYKLAARAFDEHILHLIRPVLPYFPPTRPGFSGVTFSTLVKPKGSETSLSAEYFLSWNDLQCFTKYDCTAQQILNRGFVLLDGERIDLDLEKAER
jgi:hypothetical protein